MTHPPTFDLTGRGIVITGGGGHLGSALALGLAAVGASVVICGRRPESLRTVAERWRRDGTGRVPGGCIIPEPGDAGREEDLERVLARVEKEAGRVAGFVNNSCGGPAAGLAEIDRDSIRESLAGNLGDLMLATRVVAERMGEGAEPGGSIVNVASMYGIVSPQPRTYDAFPDLHNPPVYGAAKAGLIQFTRYAACHLAPRGVRVNCISPGPFPSAAVRTREGFIDELAKRVPLARVGEANELVGPALFLLSDAASFVTGHNLVVDGGWTAW